MAVSEVKLSSAGVSGSVNAGDSKTIILGGSYRSRYRVKCDSTSDTPDIVFKHFRRTSSLPYLGRAFKIGGGFDSLSFCRGLDVNYVENSEGQFIAEARFEPTTIDAENPNQDGEPTRDPFQWHDEIEVIYSQFNVPVEQGEFRGFSSGANKHMRVGVTLPITNSARIPLDPPLEEEADIKVIRITKIARDYDGVSFDRFNGTINSDRIIINKPAYGFREVIEPYRGKMKVIGGQFQLQNKVRFWRQTVEVHKHPGPTGWIKEVLDLGMDELYTSGETTRSGMAINASTAPTGYIHAKIVDESNFPVAAPLMFNGQGKRLSPSGTPVYARWLTKKAVLWSPIRW